MLLKIFCLDNCDYSTKLFLRGMPTGAKVSESRVRQDSIQSREDQGEDTYGTLRLNISDSTNIIFVRENTRRYQLDDSICTSPERNLSSKYVTCGWRSGETNYVHNSVGRGPWNVPKIELALQTKKIGVCATLKSANLTIK